MLLLSITLSTLLLSLLTQEEKRKTDFLEKQAHFESLRKVALDQQERERQLHAQEVYGARMVIVWWKDD